jgi:ribosomal protein S18 acetylase RimI-like enzyme
MSLDPESLQAGARGAAGGAPEVIDAGAFLVCLNPHDANRYLNQAVPAAGAERAAVAAEAPRVRALMAARDRLPRVEAIAGAVPGLEQELEAQGWELEARLPVMAATPAAVRSPQAPPGLRLVRVLAGDDAGVVRRLLETQRGPFGLDPAALQDDEVERWRAQPASVGVLAELYGVPAAGGQLSPVTAGLAEVVGIATRTAYRARGLAGIVTAELARIAFERGAQAAFLTPGDARAGRVYARAGFSPVAETVSYVI